MLEAKVINRFKDKYTGRIYEPGETYRHPSEARMVELANLPTPRVEWPPQVETAMADLSGLEYRELQRLAKDKGVKANLSRDALITALQEG